MFPPKFSWSTTCILLNTQKIIFKLPLGYIYFAFATLVLLMPHIQHPLNYYLSGNTVGEGKTMTCMDPPRHSLHIHPVWGGGLHEVQLEHTFPFPGWWWRHWGPPETVFQPLLHADTLSPDGVITVKKGWKRAFCVNLYSENLKQCVCAHILTVDENLSIFRASVLYLGITKTGNDIDVILEFIRTVLEFWHKFWR